MKRYKQKEYLEDKYWKHNRSIEQIAKEEGVDKGTIFYWMKKLGVKRRTDSEALMIHHSNRIKLPKMNEDLAYALGGLHPKNHHSCNDSVETIIWQF